MECWCCMVLILHFNHIYGKIFLMSSIREQLDSNRRFLGYVYRYSPSTSLTMKPSI